MRQPKRWWIVTLVFALLLWSCVDEPVDGQDEESGPTNEDVEAPLEDLNTLTEGAPKNDELPEEAKADEQFPAQFDLVDLQSPVRSQGSRGVCSIFSTVGLMEHLYLKSGVDTDPDFSEQYLQWSAKNEVGRFRNSSGSNAAANLEAISDYGIVEEPDWPYESSPWSSSDDEDCTGDNQPTKCYTNGDPPEEALEAPKYRLPSGRWISTRTRDIKAHLHNEEEGVVVGGEFYYQSWNHSRSELPTNQEYWREGYVLYPNQEDKQVSRENPVGHSFLLVGWDDDLEVERVDGEGEVMVDENGDPETEKGFFIFKNSWGTGSFGANNPHGDGYGFISYDYVEEFLNGRVSGVPEDRHIPDTEVECGDDELECSGECMPVDADNCGACGNVCGTDEVCEGSGGAAECVEPAEAERHTYEYDGGEQTIPDSEDYGSDGEPLVVTIDVDGTGVIEEMSTEVFIEHTYQGDIEIELVAPNGDSVVLREATGASGYDIAEEFDVTEFEGLDAAGTWELRMVDTYPHDEGSLVDWTLEIVH